MSICCIAIDDDPHALESLTAYMEKLPNLQLLRTFTEPLQALSEISGLNPVDIIFMDVEMPSLSGIELATLLRQKTQHLIFTTAHPKYALDAFKVAADAYLLKPYSIVHFARTINNLYPTGKKELAFSIMDEDCFYIPHESDLMRIELNNLISAEIFEEDIELKTMTKDFLFPKLNFINTLKMLRAHPSFIQISPSVFIGKQHIKSVLGNQVLLSKGISYPVAASHQNAFAHFLQNNL